MPTKAVTKAVIDTDIAGYKPEWRVDLTSAYHRMLSDQRIADGVITSLSLSEDITP